MSRHVTVQRFVATKGNEQVKQTNKQTRTQRKTTIAKLLDDD